MPHIFKTFACMGRASGLWLALCVIVASQAHVVANAQDGGLSPAEQAMMQRLSSIQWINGPAKANIGTMAEIDVPPGYQFAAGGDAQTLLELYGNPRNPNILGAMVPMSELENWTLIFKFDEIGYVADADKESLNADEIISSFQAGLPDMNAARRQIGAPECGYISWMEPPFYDSQTNNLTWALRLGFADGESVNYDIRMLGRRGVMEATLVDSPEAYAQSVPTVKSLLSSFSFTDGNRYSQWQQGDKVAAYGLTGLVAGGGLAMAAKTGLLAKIMATILKGGKAIIIAVVVVFGGAFSLIKRLAGNGESADG